MRGTKIIVSSNPKGVFLEGIITDTSKPGTVMQITTATPVGGRHSWVTAAPGTDGNPQLIAILLEDQLQGKTTSDAYVAGTRCFLYCPAAGEEVNVLTDEGAGTANTVTIADKFMMDADIGNAIPITGSPISIPFFAMETITQFVAPALVWMTYTGH